MTVFQPYRKQAHPMNKEQGHGWEEAETNDTLNTTDNSENMAPTVIAAGWDSYNQGKNAQFSI